MKTTVKNLIITAFVILFITGCSNKDQNYIKTNGEELINFRVLPFSLADLYADTKDEKTQRG